GAIQPPTWRISSSIPLTTRELCSKIKPWRIAARRMASRETCPGNAPRPAISERSRFDLHAVPQGVAHRRNSSAGLRLLRESGSLSPFVAALGALGADRGRGIVAAGEPGSSENARGSPEDRLGRRAH